MSQTFLKPQPHNDVWVFYQSSVFVSNLQGSTTTNQQTFQYLHIDKKCVEQYADIYTWFFCLWGKILSIGHVQKIIVPLKSMHMVINTLKQCFTVLKQQKTYN